MFYNMLRARNAPCSVDPMHLRLSFDLGMSIMIRFALYERDLPDTPIPDTLCNRVLSVLNLRDKSRNILQFENFIVIARLFRDNRSSLVNDSI